MGCLISMMGLGCLVIGVYGVALRNGVLELTSIVMLFVCIILCVLDAFVVTNQGGENNQVFNWVSSLRNVRRPADDDSYYDV